VAQKLKMGGPGRGANVKSLHWFISVTRGEWLSRGDRFLPPRAAGNKKQEV
jgi:hypothetical protein